MGCEDVDRIHVLRHATVTVLVRWSQTQVFGKGRGLSSLSGSLLGSQGLRSMKSTIMLSLINFLRNLVKYDENGVSYKYELSYSPICEFKTSIQYFNTCALN